MYNVRILIFPLKNLHKKSKHYTRQNTVHKDWGHCNTPNKIKIPSCGGLPQEDLECGWPSPNRPLPSTSSSHPRRESRHLSRHPGTPGHCRACHTEIPPSRWPWGWDGSVLTDFLRRGNDPSPTFFFNRRDALWPFSCFFQAETVCCDICQVFRKLMGGRCQTGTVKTVFLSSRVWTAPP